MFTPMVEDSLSLYLAIFEFSRSQEEAAFPYIAARFEVKRRLGLTPRLCERFQSSFELQLWRRSQLFGKTLPAFRISLPFRDIEDVVLLLCNDRLLFVLTPDQFPAIFT